MDSSSQRGGNRVSSNWHYACSQSATTGNTTTTNSASTTTAAPTCTLVTAEWTSTDAANIEIEVREKYLEFDTCTVHRFDQRTVVHCMAICPVDKARSTPTLAGGRGERRRVSAPGGGPLSRVISHAETLHPLPSQAPFYLLMCAVMQGDALCAGHWLR